MSASVTSYRRPLDSTPAIEACCRNCIRATRCAPPPRGSSNVSPSVVLPEIIRIPSPLGVLKPRALSSPHDRGVHYRWSAVFTRVRLTTHHPIPAQRSLQAILAGPSRRHGGDRTATTFPGDAAVPTTMYESKTHRPSPGHRASPLLAPIGGGAPSSCWASSSAHLHLFRDGVDDSPCSSLQRVSRRPVWRRRPASTRAPALVRVVRLLRGRTRRHKECARG